MHYSPSKSLEPFVKSYTIVTIDRKIDKEILYPSGCMDMVITLPGANCATVVGGRTRNTPPVELLGHLTSPARVSATKGSEVLIVRFYPYACSLFFNNAVFDFTDFATDLLDVYGVEINDFYENIVHADSWSRKIEIVEKFLITKLIRHDRYDRKVTQVAAIFNSIVNDREQFDLKAVAKRFGLSERYIQKQFHEVVGLQPGKLYATYRFNKSLQCILDVEMSLTSVAYECGYFDQAHFIYEFKKFTGTTPSKARNLLVHNGEKFQEAVNIGI